MLKEPTAESNPRPYRVLDLTEGGCMIGGKLLGDLGADVIRIEPPQGSPSRIAPFYQNDPDPQKSLFWFAYNINKRGITLDLTRKEGQDLFKKLVKTADVVLESFEPGYLDSLNIGYRDLCAVRPDIIMAAVTPYGQTGPKASYKGDDLTAWAAGAYLYICGDSDTPPVWISFPQAGLFGGTEAAIGSMTALWHRNKTGEGQYVDVSMQECAMSPTMNVLQMWKVGGVNFVRPGGCLVTSSGVKQPIYFKCRDGYIMILAQGGTEPFISSSGRLVKWMAEENKAPEWLINLNWMIDYNASTMHQDMADKVGKAIEQFTLTKTKAELYEGGAIKRQILIAPVCTARDISEDIQLQARQYWVQVPHPELKDELVYCGPFIRMSQSPVENKKRPPLIGEHNWEVYGQELGLTAETVKELKDKGVI